MKLFLRLAWRNIWRHRLRTLSIVLTISLTMTLMFFIDGLYNGMLQDLDINTIKLNGSNIQIYAADFVSTSDTPLLPVPNDQAVVQTAESLPQVISASRRIETSGLASNKEGAFPVSITGIEPEVEQAVSSIAQRISAGRHLTSDDLDNVYIGKSLAEEMQIGVGDRFTLAGQSTHKQIRSRSMTVVGIYDVGLPSIEKSMVFMSLREAQDLYGLTEQSSEVIVSLEKISQQKEALKALRAELPGYTITDWKTNNSLYDAVETEYRFWDILSFAMLSIAGIGIFNLLQMSVFERTREIGILGAIGFKQRQIASLFLLEGSIIGLFGLVIGISLGLLTNSIFGRVGLGFGELEAMAETMALMSDRIYFTMGLEKLPLRILTVVVVSVVASFFPAREAAHHEPAEALHYL